MLSHGHKQINFVDSNCRCYLDWGKGNIVKLVNNSVDTKGQKTIKNGARLFIGEQNENRRYVEYAEKWARSK